jgi:hypothetical protein
MKKTIIALIASSIAATTLLAQKDAGNTDEQAIREAVGDYFRGVTQADRSLLEKAWDVPSGHMKWVARGATGKEEVKVMPIAAAIERWASRAQPDASSQVLSLDIVDGKMAVVKFQFIVRKTDFTDFLSLFKVNGEWKIINKIAVDKKL